ncbi:MAG TPA: hypothetical protein DHI91_01305 [Candidatus Portnoybacteria bacterium]|uniref:Photosynthesis system II assembly factor Ycf48/Hcf136-like domain-containing protein n=1 Tax=Candidatus Portnoybacteria bacterium CG02_land_8_20_14_3_00_45_8 TaxID=1974807 RepID=A0A2M7D616_9BACT|nr:MAG: hypothetical protein COS30_01975 [Candidatus Portnoybacteria bacterium CG02_land_8_20_14_3_00_45_8]HCX27760.1 hypothetical protein [Candidatus Portnoybacteria bacterium]
MISKDKLLTFLVAPVFLSTSLAVFPFGCGSANDGGVFKSIDRGENWEQKVKISKNQDIASASVLAAALDPQNPQIIYLGTKGEGIYKTMDGGELWYPIVDANLSLDKRVNVYDLAIDPKNTNNLYAGVYQNNLGRLLRSSDAGKNWEEVYRVSREKYAVFAVEVDSYDPAIIYMGTAEGGLLKSVDYGKSWRIINWLDDVIVDIKVDPRDTRIVYAATSRRGVYKTTDKGQSWQKLEGLKNIQEADNIKTLVVDYQNPSVLYIGSDDGLLKSTDGGQGWQKMTIATPPSSVTIATLTLDPTISSALYYAAGNVIYRTKDNGQSWTVHPVATRKIIKVIAFDPRSPNVIYAGVGK